MSSTFGQKFIFFYFQAAFRNSIQSSEQAYLSKAVVPSQYSVDHNCSPRVSKVLPQKSNLATSQSITGKIAQMVAQALGKFFFQRVMSSNPGQGGFSLLEINQYMMIDNHGYDGNHINGIIDLNFKGIGVRQSFM